MILLTIINNFINDNYLFFSLQKLGAAGVISSGKQLTFLLL